MKRWWPISSQRQVRWSRRPNPLYSVKTGSAACEAISHEVVFASHAACQEMHCLRQHKACCLLCFLHLAQVPKPCSTCQLWALWFTLRRRHLNVWICPVKKRKSFFAQTLCVLHLDYHMYWWWRILQLNKRGEVTEESIWKLFHNEDEIIDTYPILLSSAPSGLLLREWIWLFGPWL